MSEAVKYKLEIQLLKENKSLALEYIKEIRHFFEWNSMSLELQNLDRDSALAFIQNSYDNSKVLAGSELEKKRINLYTANRRFLDFINSQNSIDSIPKIQRIFNLYLCLSVKILQEKNCLKLIDNLINEITNIAIQEKVREEFQILSKAIDENPVIVKLRNNKNARLNIERSTIEHFGITNYQLVNALNKIDCNHNIQNTENGDLSVEFDKSKKKLKILEVQLITTKSGIQLPLSKLGILVDIEIEGNV